MLSLWHPVAATVPPPQVVAIGLLEPGSKGV